MCFIHSRFFLLWIVVFSLRAHGQDAPEYKPQFQKIVYRKAIPSQLRRLTKKVGPTRFFGKFQQGRNIYAVYLYDTNHVHSKRDYASAFERTSQLDVFQLAQRKAWQRIQSFTFVRNVEDTSDKIKIEANSLFLDPQNKTIPMVYLKVTDKDHAPIGHRTDIYGLILKQPNPKAFTTFNGYIPYSHTTVTYSEISHPDANGRLTILFIESNPGYEVQTAYGWTGEKWKVMATANFDRDFDGQRWNGKRFVPLAGDS